MWDQISFEQWQQKTNPDDLRRFKQHEGLVRSSSILDFGCGNGGFLKYASKCAKLAYGIEVDKTASMHIFNQIGCNIFSSIDEIAESIEFDYIFMFHVLEHLEQPHKILSKITEKLKFREIIIEIPNADDALLSVYKCVSFADFTYWSAHLYLYNEVTLQKLVEKAGLKINWIKQYQRYPIANHICWIQKGRPSNAVDMEEYSILSDNNLNEAYKSCLAHNKVCDTIICSIGHGGVI